MKLISLQLKTEENFAKNLKELEELIKIQEENSFILAPELTLTGYSYNRLDDAVQIGVQAIQSLKELSKNKIIALTLTTKKDNNYYNTLHIFQNEKIIHTQSKYKLFPLGDEASHFTQGEYEDIKIIEINGLKVASLICFEIRFTELWQKLLGADIILVPAMWGENRKVHYEALTKALAIANQCFVLASNSANDVDAKGSGIISPFGDEFRDDSKNAIEKEIDLSEIKKMRKYIKIGLS